VSRHRIATLTPYARALCENRPLATAGTTPVPAVFLLCNAFVAQYKYRP